MGVEGVDCRDGEGGEGQKEVGYLHGGEERERQYVGLPCVCS